MSASMHWRPANPIPEGHVVYDGLRQKLARRLWDHDGTLTSDPHPLTKEDVPYLEGLRDGGVSGAQDLIDAIRKHGTIDVWIER